jgi:hypothetical protein
MRIVLHREGQSVGRSGKGQEARMNRKQLTAYVLLAALSALLPRGAHAQQAQQVATSFDQLGRLEILEPGDKVWVTFVFESAEPETEIEGRLMSITDSSLTLESSSVPSGSSSGTVTRVGTLWHLEIPAERIRSIRVYRKVPRWGMLAGGLAGAAVGFVFASEWSRNEGPGDCTQCYLYFGALFGLPGMGVGWGIDLARDKRPTVYSATAPGVALPETRLTVNPLIGKTGSGLQFRLTW